MFLKCQQSLLLLVLTLAITLGVVLTSTFVWAFREAGETTDPVKK